jgi:hypothetical protein
MRRHSPKKPTLAANLAAQLGITAPEAAAPAAAPPPRPRLSRELVDSLLPPVPTAPPAGAPITINLAAGAVLNLYIGAPAPKEA